MTALLSVEGVAVDYGPGLRALQGIDLAIAPGECVGLVGESGSGKSTLGLAIMGLIDPPGGIAEGRVLFEGADITRDSEAALNRLRGKRLSMIFQDPMSVLNPVLTIGTQVAECVRAHRRVSRRAAWDLAELALRDVGIPAPRDRLSSFPHELSGGMRQRVAIAAAMINAPALLIGDEPTTALDVTVQKHVLGTVRKLCAAKGTALLWISHDIGVIRQMADRVAVMYRGRIVELGPVDRVIGEPQHPYTQSLIASVRALHDGTDTPVPKPVLPGDDGCVYRERCPHATDACRVAPALKEVAPDHQVRCIHPGGAACS